MANFFEQFHTAKEDRPTENFFSQFHQPQEQQKPAPTESGGFGGSYVESLKERLFTAKPATQLFANVGDQKQATDELLKYKEESQNAYKQTEFGEIGDAFKAGNFGDALSKTVDKFKEVAGSSLGSITPAGAIGVGARVAAGAAFGAASLPAAAIGTAAFGIVTLGSYIADNIGRQKQEQEKKGDKYADIDRLPATVAAAGSTALDLVGFKFFKPLGRLVGIEGKEASERAALEIVEAATNPKAYRNAVLKGTAQGIAFEVPQEVSQQVLERWQAGLALNPFDDPEAAKEYAEAAGGAMLLGGPMGGASKVAQTYQARQTPEGQTLLQGTDAIQSRVLDNLGGEQDVEQPINPPVGAGVSVDTPPPPPAAPAGAGTTDTSGVVRTNRAPAGPAGRETTSAGSLEDFSRQYNDLRSELLGLMNKSNPTDADRRQVDLVYRDFNEVITANADRIEAAGGRTSSFFNPAFDGNKVIGEMATNDVVGKAKASQGDMFGSFESANRNAQLAMAFTGRDPVKAIQHLEDRKQRALEQFEKNKDDPVFGMTYGSQLGMTKGQAARNPEAVAKHILDQTLANVDQAIDQLKRRAKPSQGDIFGEGERKAPELTEDQKAELLKGEQGEMIGDTTDPATIARMELIKKQEEIEKRRKDVAYEVTQTTPQERLEILTKREADFKRRHEAALAEHKRLSDLNKRPAEERFARPSTSEVDRAKAMAVSYNKELNDVRKEIEKTKKEAETYTPPVQAKVAETAAPTTVESTQEQPKLFADEAGASTQGEATKYVTPSGQGFKLPTQAQPAPLSTAVDKDKFLSKEEQENISAAKENRLADATEKDLKAAVVIRDAALKKLRALEASLQEAAAKDAPKSQIDKIMSDIEVAKQEYRVAAIEVADIYDVLESKGVKFKSADVSQKLDEDEEIKTSTEHIPQTEEGGIISDFFDSIQPQSNEEASVIRHGSSKGTAAKTMLIYDIAEPGQKSSDGAQKMLDYIASQVGGVEKLKDLISALYNATPAQQSRMFEKLGLPDLTTIRGMDKFRDEIQQFVDDLNSSGEGINLLTRNMPSPFYGRPIPYTETITTVGIVTQTSEFESGKPRQPNQVETETEHVLTDRKLRNAVLMLKQALGVGKGLSDRQHAAINYLFKNKHRDSFGDALADLAFDLAYGVIDPDQHGKNSTFFGEGGEYARDFREWVVLNLDQSTVDILNQMVAQHARNHAENVKLEEAKSENNAKRKEYSEKQVQAYEKRTGQKLRRAPKKVRIGDVKEVEQERTVRVKNLPTIHIVPPIVTRLLEQGKVQEALQIMSDSKGNPYYAALAQRLLDTGMTAKSRVINVDLIESLNNDPNIKESLDKRLEVLRDLVVTMYPTERQASITAGLRSSKLRELTTAIQTLQSTIDSVGASEGQKQALESTYKLLEDEFNWNGKYDPATDEIVLRSGEGKLTNTLFLHESLHAAASHLIDNADKLTGIQRQGYDRLVELYEYSKKALAAEEFNNEFYDLNEFVSYGLTDPVFQAHLRTLGYKAAPYSMWNIFTDAIRKLFNVKTGYESNVMVETMLAADTLLSGSMMLEGLNVAGAKPAKAKKTKTTTFKPGMPNQPGAIARLMKGSSWSQQAMKEFRSMTASARPAALGLLTLRQIDDLVAGRIPQLSNFIKVTEDFLARKNGILKESGEISKAWEKLQGKSPEKSRQIGLVMHMATITEIDPDKATLFQRNNNQDLMTEWKNLDDEGRRIYREVRNFYEQRYTEYKRLMRNRINSMSGRGLSNYKIAQMLARIEGVPESVLNSVEEFSPSVDTVNALLRSGFTKKVEADLAAGGADKQTILSIREKFEKEKIKGPYFPLMRFGRFWYEIGPKNNREYYMFETQAARDAHIEERIAKDPYLADTIGTSIGNDFKSQMSFHAQQSNLLKEMFDSVDQMDVSNLTPAEAEQKKQSLKDEFYQTFLENLPDNSMRKRFIHRQNKAGYSEDALRSFATSSFNMAYQLSRFEHSPKLFSQLEAAKLQLKGRFDPKVGYDPAVIRENDELNDYIGETRRRLDLILNPTDVGTIPSMLSNVGFIYYLSSAASAITNVLGGVMIGFPTLVGQKVKLDPKMSYAQATTEALFEASKSVAQAIAGMAKGVNAPPSGMSKVEQAAFNRFVADGLIDITATYDQSGLASTPTENYSGLRHKSMKALTFLFHQAERLNREVVAMTAFRTAYAEATKAGLSPRAAFTKAVANAKDVTNRSMFDYSSTNKPRYFQHPVARVVLQFKQFPQQMTFFLAHNLVNSLKGESPEIRREARARFVGTMGMAAIMSGGTGLWGFSTVASVINAVFNAMADDDDELPFDFELAFANWATETFGAQVGMAITRGIPNAVTGLDIGGRVKLDDMWFRDGRKNQDEADALQSFLVDALGPTIGIGINAARAVDLYNQGHGDRAIEAISPAFIKNALIAGRMGREGGATTLRGDMLTEDDSPFTLMMQGLGLRSAELAERQYYNITVKGAEQAILKERQNLLNYYGLTFMSNDVEANEKAFDKIMEFNQKHASVAIPAKSIISSIKNRVKKSVQTDHGMYIDPRLRAQLSQQDYLADQ
jgi:hypothetical protein